MSKSLQHPDVSPPAACAIVIFGANGDLTKRLLIPAVYNLASAGMLPEKFAVVGVAIESISAAPLSQLFKIMSWKVLHPDAIADAVDRSGLGQLTMAH